MPAVAVIAGDELAQGVVKLKDMRKSEEQTVPRSEVAAAVRSIIG